MQSDDFERFAHLWEACWDAVGRRTTGGAINLAFDDLAAYPFAAVKAAMAAHRNGPNGRNPPTVADILAVIDGLSGRQHPGADEAWGIAQAAMDEAETVVWTAEMVEAWGTARDVFKFDKVGARLAFRAAYERLVAASVAMGQAPKWSASLGLHQGRRAVAIAEAVRLGRLPASARHGLPGPEPASGLAGLLENLERRAVKAGEHSTAATALAHLRAIRQSLETGEAWSAEQQARREAKAQAETKKQAELARIKDLTGM